MEAIAPLVAHVALLLSVLALIGSALTWYFSRAGKVIGFNQQMGQAVAQVVARIEAQDLRIAGMQTAEIAQTDEMNRVLERIVLERKRIKQANAIATKREEDAEAPPAPAPPATREEQKRALEARMNGGGT